jgi:hypothetical protein
MTTTHLISIVLAIVLAVMFVHPARAEAVEATTVLLIVGAAVAVVVIIAVVVIANVRERERGRASTPPTDAVLVALDHGVGQGP